MAKSKDTKDQKEKATAKTPKAPKTLKADKSEKLEKAERNESRSGSKTGKAKRVSAVGTARLKLHFREKVIAQLQKEFEYANTMQVPKIQKVTLNMGVGSDDKKVVKAAQDNLTDIAGQKAIITYARKSVAGFKIREGWPIGCKVTLRGDRMYEFLDRLLSIVLPRVRDFRGLNPRSFDSRGNYSLGLKEQVTFPEIDYNQVDAVRGLDITITTSAPNDTEALALLRAFNFPFREARTAEVKPNVQ